MTSMPASTSGAAAMSTASSMDLAFDPDLRIPPLQHPLPLSLARRPPPLEPRARVNAVPPRGTLSSRAAALDEAQPLDGPRTVRSPTPASRTSRKKPKVALLQLPQPAAPTSSADAPPTFNTPLPVLHELHQPPPSAGLFPPIAPIKTLLKDNELVRNVFESGTASARSLFESEAISDHSIIDGDPKAGSGPGPNITRSGEPSAFTLPQTPMTGSSTSLPTSLPPQDRVVQPKAKRKCLRARLKWTDAETQDLLKGVGIYGVGKWKKILTHPDLHFHPERTMVDLKDRYRTCRMNEEKAIERQAAAESTCKASDGIAAGMESGQSTPEHGTRRFEVTTAAAYEAGLTAPKERKRGASNPWTAAEDAAVSRGYQRYGFQWTAIAKDPELGLSSRTGPQVRDRFRTQYPVIYQSSVPLPLPDAPRRVPRPRPRRGDSGEAKSQLTFIMHDPGVAKRARPVLPSLHNPTSRPPPPAPSISSATSSPSTPAILLPDRFSGLNVQPLPEPDARRKGDERDAYRDFCLEKDIEVDQISSVSDGEADVLDDEDEDDEDSAPAGPSGPVVDPDEVRHLSILGLLNDDEDQRSLPPFHAKYVLDDWDPSASGEGGESLTLPPLLTWDDMSNKPIFDL